MMALLNALNSFRVQKLLAYKLVTRVTHTDDGPMSFSSQKENDKTEMRQRENPISKSRMRKVGFSVRDATPGSV
jgi:hypothetical protein